MFQQSCDSEKQNLNQSNGSDQTIKTVIEDFSKTEKLYRNNSIFGLAKKDVLQLVKKSDTVSDEAYKMINNIPYLALTHITINVNPISLSEDAKSQIGQKGITIPTRYLVKDNKLFFWWDKNYPFKEDAYKVYKKFGLIDNQSESRNRYDENPEGKHYYFCGKNNDEFIKVNLKEDLSNYDNAHLICD